MFIAQAFKNPGKIYKSKCKLTINLLFKDNFLIYFNVVSTICIFNSMKFDIVLYTLFDTSHCECWFQAIGYESKIEWHVMIDCTYDRVTNQRMIFNISVSINSLLCRQNKFLWYSHQAIATKTVVSWCCCTLPQEILKMQGHSRSAGMGSWPNNTE